MRITVPTAAALLALSACTTAPAPPRMPSSMAPAPAIQGTAKQAVANLSAASGSLVSGKITLMPMGGGVHMTGMVGGLAPNSVHGFHIHEKGDCGAADASSAGGHFAPGGTAHGRRGSGPHHAGDIDNITANAEGVASINAHLDGLVIGGGASNDIAGRAIVVHAKADDYTSQPSGDAGARVACAVINVTM